MKNKQVKLNTTVNILQNKQRHPITYIIIQCLYIFENIMPSEPSVAPAIVEFSC
jgi:hypothetical protein